MTNEEISMITKYMFIIKYVLCNLGLGVDTWESKELDSIATYFSDKNVKENADGRFGM